MSLLKRRCWILAWGGNGVRNYQPPSEETGSIRINFDVRVILLLPSLLRRKMIAKHHRCLPARWKRRQTLTLWQSTSVPLQGTCLRSMRWRHMCGFYVSWIQNIFSLWSGIIHVICYPVIITYVICIILIYRSLGAWIISIRWRLVNSVSRLLIKFLYYTWSMFPKWVYNFPIKIATGIFGEDQCRAFPEQAFYQEEAARGRSHSVLLPPTLPAPVSLQAWARNEGQLVRQMASHVHNLFQRKPSTSRPANIPRTPCEIRAHAGIENSSFSF